MIKKLLTNENLINLYKQVEDYENIDPLAMGYHNYTHALNVLNLMTSIMEQLNINKDDINDYQVAALLHDIGAYCGKKDHHLRSGEMAKSFIEENNIILKDKNRVINAILNHSSESKELDLLTAILIFADKMDMTYQRVAPAGKYDIGMKQFLHVEKIDVKITENSLNVYFKVDNNCNKKEIENYYFFAKMIKSIESLSEKLNLSYEVYYNNEIWDYNL